MAADLRRLGQGLLGLEIEASDAERLVAFAGLVSAWSDRMNLVSADSVEEILARHVLDSLAPVALLRDARRIADIGSGAGFPGIPLAIALPEARFELIESRRKRASFLRHALRSLSVGNASVHEIRAEDWRSDVPPDAAVGRAVRIDVLANFSRRMLSADGVLVAMRKADLPAIVEPGFVVERSLAYSLPSGERHEVVALRRCST